MPWYVWCLLMVLGLVMSYIIIWLSTVEAQLSALRVDHNAILKKLTGRTDGATLSEALDKGPNSITALKEFLDEHEPTGL